MRPYTIQRSLHSNEVIFRSVIWPPQIQTLVHTHLLASSVIKASFVDTAKNRTIMKIYFINKNFNDGGGMIMTCVQFNPDRLNWDMFYLCSLPVSYLVQIDWLNKSHNMSSSPESLTQQVSLFATNSSDRLTWNTYLHVSRMQKISRYIYLPDILSLLSYLFQSDDGLFLWERHTCHPESAGKHKRSSASTTPLSACSNMNIKKNISILLLYPLMSAFALLAFILFFLLNLNLTKSILS